MYRFSIEYKGVESNHNKCLQVTKSLDFIILRLYLNTLRLFQKKVLTLSRQKEMLKLFPCYFYVNLQFVLYWFFFNSLANCYTPNSYCRQIVYLLYMLYTIHQTLILYYILIFRTSWLLFFKLNFKMGSVICPLFYSFVRTPGFHV